MGDLKFYPVNRLKQDLGGAAPGKSAAYQLAAKGLLKLTRLNGRTGITSQEWERFVATARVFEPRVSR